MAKVKRNKKNKSSSKWPKVLVALAAFLLYANTLGHNYAQDDAIVIYDNMFTQEGFSGIPGLLSNDTFYGFFKEEGKANLVSGGRYRPLTPVMFAIEHAFFDSNPFVGHLFNVLWHVVLALMVYYCLRRLCIGSALSRSSFFVLSATLIYIAHPVHTEVVANIKGRDEIMAMLGAVFSLYAVLRYTDAKQIKWAWMALAGFFLGLMSKENTITFLAVAPLALVMFRKFTWIRALKATWPLAVAAFVFLVIRSSVLGLDFGGTPRELMNNPFLKWENGQWLDFSFSEKAASIFFTLGKYIQLLVFPHPLSHDYYPRAIPLVDFSNWKVLLSVLMHILLAVVALKTFKKRSLVSFGILYYLITLSIVSNIVFPIGTHMSERFLFMPSLGFAIVVAYLLSIISKPKAAYAILAVLILAYSAKTISRNTVWKDDYTLFTTDVNNDTRSAKLLNAAGGAISNRVSSMPEGPQKTKLINEAIGYLQKAIDIHPTYRNAYLILGNSYYYAGRYNEAIEMYEKVLSLSPGYGEALRNFPIILREAAKSVGQKQRNYDQAEKWLLKAYGMNPNDFETLRLLGITYGIKGNHTKAIEYFNKALEVRPDSAVVHASLGTAWLNLGDREKANSYFQRAQELDPNALNHLKN